jgi:hypothetical protein
MNNNPKDVSLFDQYDDPDQAAEEGRSIYLSKMDTGKWIDEQMEGVRKFCAANFDHDESPLWPKLGSHFITEFCETRRIDKTGDSGDEFGLIWRDVIFTYYKRFGRSTYVSRELSSEEATQFIKEVKEALESCLEAVIETKATEVAAKIAATPPPTPEQLDAVEASRAAAAAVIAEHDADPIGFYTFRERRELMAVKLNYQPSYKAVESADDANNLLDILHEEQIPYERPGYWLSKEEILAELNRHYGCGVNVAINKVTPENTFKVTEWEENPRAVLLHVEVPGLGPWRMLHGMVEADAWRIAYRRTFDKDPIRTQH